MNKMKKKYTFLSEQFQNQNEKTESRKIHSCTQFGTGQSSSPLPLHTRGYLQYTEDIDIYVMC